MIEIKAWRYLALPFFELIGGGKFPKGKLSTYQYGDLPEESLDAISVSQSSSVKTPIVHIHGGGWIAGSKGRLYARPLMRFVDSGYPIFSLNYPLAPEYPHPQALRSCLRALAWIKKYYPNYPSIYLIGDSAGGNLAMMLGLLMSNPELMSEVDSMDSNLLPKVKGVVPMYAPLDRMSWIEDGFPSAKTFLKSYAGLDALDPNKVQKIPVTPMDIVEFVDIPPTFIVAGGKDKLARSSKIYADHLRKQGRSIDYKVYPAANHGFFSLGAGHAELIQDLKNYFKKIDES